MAKLKAMTKKQWYIFLAVLVAVCILVPSIAIGVHVWADNPKLAMAASGKSSESVVTSKTATPNGDGSYHIKVEAYNTAYNLQVTPTDNVLVLEGSDDMKKELYTRDKKNLHTYAMFTAFPLEQRTMERDTDEDNRFVEDPHAPGRYVYLYFKEWSESTGWFSSDYFCQFYMTDTQGNQYRSGKIDEKKGFGPNYEERNGKKVIPMTWYGNINYSNLDDYDEYVRKTGRTNTLKEVVYDTVYHRETKGGDDNNATNSYLFQETKYTGLYIKDDYNQFCPVTITRKKADLTDLERVYDDPAAAYYIYETTDSKGKKFTATYGCSETNKDGNGLGQYSAFQGFVSYHQDGTIDTQNSMIHRSLYKGNTNESVTKLLAMQEGAEDFVLKIHKNAMENHLTNGEMKVGVISYAGLNEEFPGNEASTKTVAPLTDVYSEKDSFALIKTIYKIEAVDERRIDIGMRYAKDMLDNTRSAPNNMLDTRQNPGSDKSHDVNVVAFTTGMPTKHNAKDFDRDVADAAIAASYSIKHDYPKSKVYTIGMYDHADSSQLHGDWYYRGVQSNIPCDGSVGSFWGDSHAAWVSNEMGEKNGAAVNRFLNYMSSNFADAQALGLGGLKDAQGTGWETWLVGGSGYLIRQNEERTADGYYYGATDSDTMLEAFNSIADIVQVPLTTLGSKTQLVDGISDYFNLKGAVTAYTMDYDGSGKLDNEGSWSNRQDVQKPSVSDDGKTVTATGFDFAAHYCDAKNKVDGKNLGQKLVVEFDVTPIDGFLGGHNVPTNRSDSAVIDEQGSTVETLPQPKVNLPLVNNTKVKDQYVYYSNEADLEQLFELDKSLFDGRKNDFVNVTYEVIDPELKVDETTHIDPNPVLQYRVNAGSKEIRSNLSGESKSQQYPVLDKNKTYQVKVSVSTTENDQEKVETAEKAQDAVVYVYKPTVTVKDMKKNYSDASAGVDLNKNVVKVDWAAEGTDHAAPTENAPELEYDFTDRTAQPNQKVTDPSKHSVKKTTDYRVDLTVKGHKFSYETELPFYVKTDGSKVLKSTYQGDKSDLKKVTTTEIDKDGKEQTVVVKDADGNPVYEEVTETTTVHADQADRKDSDKHFAKYRNESDASKTNGETEGNFTIYTGGTYELYLQKVFSGPYAQPEAVVFTLTGSDGSEQTLTFNADEFKGQKSGEKKANAQLSTDVTYTLTEGYADQNTDSARYSTTATKQLDSAAAEELPDLNPNDTVGNFRFSVDSASNPTKLSIVVKNTDTQQTVPDTGVTDATRHIGIIIGAAVGALALLGGAGVYEYRRRRHIGE